MRITGCEMSDVSMTWRNEPNMLRAADTLFSGQVPSAQGKPQPPLAGALPGPLFPKLKAKNFTLLKGSRPRTNPPILYFKLQSGAKQVIKLL